MWTRKNSAFGPFAFAVCFSLLCSTSAAAPTISPLPRSDYSVRALCTPPAPEQGGCLALQLVPQTAQARAHTHPLGMSRPAPAALAPATTPEQAGYIGLRPQDLHSVYVLPTTASTPQTIALVDAYNDPTAEADLKTYDEEFGLPECTSANGCFGQVNQSGAASPLPFPKTTAELEAARLGSASKRKEAERATGWGGEISLDIETAHAVCESCTILLVEAENSAVPNLTAAEHSAEKLGSTEISNSWGGPELGQSVEQEATSSFNDPGIVITASAGDDGYLSWAAASSAERGYADFPASSPHVVAVGGTRLHIEANGSWAGESVWNGDGAGGGGCSTIFEAPMWQQNVAGFGKTGCRHKRAVSDIAADADPYTGLAIRDTSPTCSSEYEEGGTTHVLAHWCTIGGTSLASPLIASVFALAGGAKGSPYPAQTLYQNALATPAALHDVTSGSNGECALGFEGETGLSSCTPGEEGASCSAKRICLAGSGYDGPSGLGTPNGISGFERSSEDEASAEEVLHPEEESEEGAEPGGSEPGGSGAGKEAQPQPGGHGAEAGAPGGTPAPAPPSSPLATAASKLPARLSSLALTRSALIALNRPRPRSSAIGFLFTLSAGAKLRATLTRRVHAHGHSRWSSAQRLTFTAAAGRGKGRLGGRGALAPGQYRLTLAASGGNARSIVFQIG